MDDPNSRGRTRAAEDEPRCLRLSTTRHATISCPGRAELYPRFVNAVLRRSARFPESPSRVPTRRQTGRAGGWQAKRGRRSKADAWQQGRLRRMHPRGRPVRPGARVGGRARAGSPWRNSDHPSPGRANDRDLPGAGARPRVRRDSGRSPDRTGITPRHAPLRTSTPCGSPVPLCGCVGGGCAFVCGRRRAASGTGWRSVLRGAVAEGPAAVVASRRSRRPRLPSVMAVMAVKLTIATRPRTPSSRPRPR